MELSEFISKTLVQIVDGVRDGQETIGGRGGMAVPDEFLGDHGGLLQAEYQLIEIDVAVSESEGVEAKSGIGVFLGGIGIGAQGANDSQSVSLNRLRFKFPVMLPVRESANK